MAHVAFAAAAVEEKAGRSRRGKHYYHAGNEHGNQKRVPIKTTASSNGGYIRFHVSFGGV